MKKVLAFLVVMGLGYSIYGQVDVYWRTDGPNSGEWQQGDNPCGEHGQSNAYPWWYNGWTSNEARGRPDCYDDGSGHIIHFDNDYQTSMELNESWYNVYQILFQNNSPRTINGTNGIDMRREGAKIENQSSGTHILNAPLAYHVTTELNPVTGNLVFNLLITNNGHWTDVWGGEEKSLTISGGLSGTGGLAIKSNTLVIITGNALFEGGTTVEAGTLELQGSIASSAVTVQNGATLKINGDDVTVASLTVDEGGIVNIEPGKSLTVNGAFSNSGTVTIKSDNTGTGSLKTISTVSGSITSQRYFGGSNWDWHLLSSPVTDQTIQNEFVPATFTADEDFYCYYEPTSEWVNYKNSTTPPTWTTANGDNTFVEGKGYMVSYYANGFTKSFTGTPNTGSQSFSLSKVQTTGDYIGINLAGNPYPSSIDWKAVSGWTRGDLVNTNTLENPHYNMYIWNPTENNYGVYNSGSVSDFGTNSVTRYIPPMQGFFVTAETAGSISMTNDVRVHNNASSWLKNGDNNSTQLRVIVSSEDNYGKDEVVIETGHETSTGGALKMFSFVESAPSLYLPKENKNYAISFLQDLPVGTTIPLYFGAGIDGQYELRFTFDDQLYTNVKLSDKETGAITDINENSVYQFFSAKDANPNRFLLHFGMVGFGEQEQAPTLQVYMVDNRLYVNNSLEQAQLAVYDLQGRLVARQSLNSGGLQALPLELPAGVYIVRLNNASESRTVKINVQ